ncbi:MAG: hypothetical protein G01um101433_307 [Parcubacteria group bacterium Gr01-1014_33]|nr:MAG: hypothetical protein G01um101433_307 [Parcubacteria group bacterium Gr01-1014_33]
MQRKMVEKKQRMTLDKLAMITQQQFLDIQEIMATKEDLKYFATKEDLKYFATKEDLKYFATKEDLKYFATKEDLNQQREDIIQDVRLMHADVIQSNDKVITKLDILLKEHAAHTMAHKRIDGTLFEHNKRIKKIEEKVI